MATPVVSASPPGGGAPRLVSVIVACYNARSTIERCIDSILTQDCSPVELIVVDDGSDDGTRELLAARPDWERFRVIELERGGPSHARNEGVAATHGDYVALFDADCWLHEGCLRCLVASLLPLPVVSCGGRQELHGEETAIGRDIERLFHSLGFLTEYLRSGRAEKVRDTEHNPSCNVLYRKREFMELGGFDEGLWPGEDVDLDRRATLRGFRHCTFSGAVVGHLRPGSISSLWRKVVAYGRSHWLLVKRYGSFRRLHRVAVGCASLAALLVAGWLLLSWRFGASLWWGATLPIFALLLFEIWRRWTGQGWRSYVLGVVVVVGWATGLFAEVVAPRFEATAKLRDFGS